MSKRFYLSPREKVLAGVCGGLAEYFDTDPTIVRLLWIVFTLCGGCGIIAYLIVWLIAPRTY